MMNSALPRRPSILEQETDRKFLRPLGKRALMAKINHRLVSIHALVANVTQDPEPDAFPSIKVLEAAVQDTAEKHLRRHSSR